MKHRQMTKPASALQRCADRQRSGTGGPLGAPARCTSALARWTLADSGDSRRHDDAAIASVGTERSLRPDGAMSDEASRDATAGTKSASDWLLAFAFRLQPSSKGKRRLTCDMKGSWRA